MDVIQSAMSALVEQDELDSMSASTSSPFVAEKMAKQMLLIKLIKQDEPLFNHQHDDYRNILKKDHLWRKIAETIGWSETRCKSKWKAMRDQYCRELKRERSNPNASIRWKYFQYMEFLRPHALYRRSLFPATSSYRTKVSTTKAKNEDSSQQEETSQDDEMHSIHDQLCSTMNVKTESWKMYTESSEMVDSTSQMIDEINSNLEGVTPQDDEDDDPIHTFLNIESYFENELISMIKAEEVLYNNQNRAYRNVKLKQKIWEDIARKLNRTVRQCRTKWKALRDQYIREHKRLLQSSNPKLLQRWKHYDAMAFLKNYIRQRNGDNGTLENFHKVELRIPTEHLEEEQMITEPTEENHLQFISTDQETSQICMKSNYSRRSDEEDPIEEEPIEERTKEHAADDVNDEVGVFFRAIAMKIRNAKMPSTAFTELQIDILQVINKALRD